MGDRQLIRSINFLTHRIEDTHELGTIVGWGILYGALHQTAHTPHEEFDDIEAVEESLEEILSTLDDTDLKNGATAYLLSDLADKVAKRLEAYKQRDTTYQGSLIEKILPADWYDRDITHEDMKRAGLNVINKAFTQGIRNERSAHGGDFSTIVYGFRRHWRRKL